jgi:mono/diheme cytochrome c family protein
MNKSIKGAAFTLFGIAAATIALAQKPVHHRTSIAASMTRGKVVYNNICLACHMADGNGVPMMNPPIVKTDYILGDKARLIKIVLNGFKEDVQINGQSFSNNMSPHADLSDAQIADVLTFVRNSFGNKASRVTPLEVKKVRAANTGPKS